MSDVCPLLEAAALIPKGREEEATAKGKKIDLLKSTILGS